MSCYLVFRKLVHVYVFIHVLPVVSGTLLEMSPVYTCGSLGNRIQLSAQTGTHMRDVRLKNDDLPY